MGISKKKFLQLNYFFVLDKCYTNQNISNESKLFKLKSDFFICTLIKDKRRRFWGRVLSATTSRPIFDVHMEGHGIFYRISNNGLLFYYYLSTHISLHRLSTKQVVISISFPPSLHLRDFVNCL